MSDVFTLDGVPLDLAAADALPLRYRERFGAPAELTIQRRGIQPPPEGADTWMGRRLTWSYNGTLYFNGTIRSRAPRQDDLVGWVVDYQAIGLYYLGNKFPITDKTTGLDVSPFNCQPEDLAHYDPARAGRSVGQILTDVLTSSKNAQNLDAYGLGRYTGLPSDPTLPAATVADLSALVTIPPKPVYLNGEKFLEAIDAFLQQFAPNHRLWVQPDGTLRFLDLRGFAANARTLTMGVDPIEPTEIMRDISGCWQRIEIRGQPIAVMRIFKTSAGTLVEDFAWGSYDNNSAKAAWSPNDYNGTSHTQDVGTCVMTSTDTIVVTSADPTRSWPAGYWDQTATGAKGTINLEDPVATGVTSFWTGRIVASSALTPGGTATLTIDVAAPATSYTHYTISGYANGASLVWRRYRIVDSTLWPLIVAQSTYPQPFVNPGGGAALTSTPMGAVFWPQDSNSDGPPYNMFPLPFAVDTGSGRVTFVSPTYMVANGRAPADVWAMLPINTAQNVVHSPPDADGAARYAGDTHDIEGLAETLVCTLPDWRDPGQAPQLQAFADDWLDAIKDGIREGAVVYYGLYEPALTFGLALNIAGADGDGPTGWESAALPVVEVSVEWPQGAYDYVTTMHVSNRRGHATAETYLHPERAL